jgi:hypothetical protein
MDLALFHAVACRVELIRRRYGFVERKRRAAVTASFGGVLPSQTVVMRIGCTSVDDASGIPRAW